MKKVNVASEDFFAKKLTPGIAIRHVCMVDYYLQDRGR